MHEELNNEKNKGRGISFPQENQCLELIRRGHAESDSKDIIYYYFSINLLMYFSASSAGSALMIF